MTEIKKLFKAYETAEQESNRLYSLLENDLDNEELEAQWDAAYNKEYTAHEALVAEIVKITSGMIDSKTARAMIASKKTELKNLIGRLAA